MQETFLLIGRLNYGNAITLRSVYGQGHPSYGCERERARDTPSPLACPIVSAVLSCAYTGAHQILSELKTAGSS